MAGQAASDWEDVLNAHLEGRGLRADAEDLLMRLHLDPGDREQVERALRLSDEVTAAVRTIQPPLGMEGRLLAQLRACPAPGIPRGWEPQGGAFARAAASPLRAEEDLLDAAVEGRLSADELRAMRDAGEWGEAAREALDELEVLGERVVEASAADAAPAAGAAGRLRDALRAHMGSEAGEIDGRVVHRLLSAKAPRRGTEAATPDVRAAEESPDATDDDESGQ